MATATARLAATRRKPRRYRRYDWFLLDRFHHTKPPPLQLAALPPDILLIDVSAYTTSPRVGSGPSAAPVDICVAAASAGLSCEVQLSSLEAGVSKAGADQADTLQIRYSSCFELPIPRPLKPQLLVRPLGRKGSTDAKQRSQQRALALEEAARATDRDFDVLVQAAALPLAPDLAEAARALAAGRPPSRTFGGGAAAPPSLPSML